MPDDGTTNYRPRLFGPPDWREDRRLFRPPTLSEACAAILKRLYPPARLRAHLLPSPFRWRGKPIAMRGRRS